MNRVALNASTLLESTIETVVTLFIMGSMITLVLGAGLCVELGGELVASPGGSLVDGPLVGGEPVMGATVGMGSFVGHEHSIFSSEQNGKRVGAGVIVALLYNSFWNMSFW